MSQTRVRCHWPARASTTCHGVDHTMCGLWLDSDVCLQGNVPETCDDYPGDVDRDDEDGND